MQDNKNHSGARSVLTAASAILAASLSTACVAADNKSDSVEMLEVDGSTYPLNAKEIKVLVAETEVEYPTGSGQTVKIQCPRYIDAPDIVIRNLQLISWGAYEFSNPASPVSDASFAIVYNPYNSGFHESTGGKVAMENFKRRLGSVDITYKYSVVGYQPKGNGNPRIYCPEVLDPFFRVY